MTQGLIVGAILVAALACPVTMWLGRRGIGPGCDPSARSTKRVAGESLDELRRREREIADRIAQLEAGDGEPETGPGGARRHGASRLTASTLGAGRERARRA